MIYWSEICGVRLIHRVQFAEITNLWSVKHIQTYSHQGLFAIICAIDRNAIFEFFFELMMMKVLGCDC